MIDEINKKRIDFEDQITNVALESGLELGMVIKSLSAVQYRFKQAKENLANKADVRKVVEYAEHKLFIGQDSHVQAISPAHLKNQKREHLSLAMKFHVPIIAAIKHYDILSKPDT